MSSERVEKRSALIVLFLGVSLLVLTFFVAVYFLFAPLTILASSDLTELFGRALAPLMEAIIRILFLGVMGWVGSILTIRAVQLLKKDKEPTFTQPQSRPETKQTSPQPATTATQSPKTQVVDAKKPEDAKTTSTESSTESQNRSSDTPAK